MINAVTPSIDVSTDRAYLDVIDKAAERLVEFSRANTVNSYLRDPELKAWHKEHRLEPLAKDVHALNVWIALIHGQDEDKVFEDMVISSLLWMDVA